MVLSSSYSLKLISVAMVVILKNFQTIIIALGDRYFYNRAISLGTVASIVLMFVATVVSGFNDLEFNMEGYVWVLLNCVIGASYILYMKLTTIKSELGDFGNVFYNNSLSIPLVLVFIILNGELSQLLKYNFSKIHYPLMIYNGITACGLSFASFWAMRETSPTSYSIAGALNKIPTTIIGIIFFHTPLTITGSCAMAIALLGGVIYASLNKKDVKPVDTAIIPAQQQSGNNNV